MIENTSSCDLHAAVVYFYFVFFAINSGNLTISFGSEDDDETRQKFAGTNTIIPKRQDIQNICKGTAKKGVK
jgi:hypothetical protein